MKKFLKNCWIKKQFDIKKDTPTFWILSAFDASMLFLFFTKLFIHKFDIQSAVLSGTAVILIWYSWETSLLRKETQKQNNITKERLNILEDK